MEELAKQIQSHVDAHSDPANASWPDSRFHTQVLSLRRHLARQMKEFMETESAQRRFRGRAWWNAGGAGGDVAAAGGKVQALGGDGAGRGKAEKERGRGRGKGKQAGGGSVVPPAK